MDHNVFEFIQKYNIDPEVGYALYRLGYEEGRKEPEPWAQVHTPKDLEGSIYTLYVLPNNSWRIQNRFSLPIAVGCNCPGGSKRNNEKRILENGEWVLLKRSRKLEGLL